MLLNILLLLLIHNINLNILVLSQILISSHIGIILDKFSNNSTYLLSISIITSFLYVYQIGYTTEYPDIKLITSDLGDEIKGFFQRTETGYEIININLRLAEEEKKYIYAHELDHTLLHTEMSISFFIENSLQLKNKYEIEGDKFATELLIGDNINDIDYSELNVEQICSSLCVLVKLMKYKFNLDM